MRSSDGQVTATCRHVLLTGGRDPEAEDDEAEEPDEQADRAVEQRGLRLGLPAEPRQSLDSAAAGGGHGLGRDARRGRSTPASRRLGHVGRSVGSSGAS